MGYGSASTRRTARKPHTCEACQRIIEPGEQYTRGIAFEDMYTWVICTHCSALLRLYRNALIPDEGWNNETFEAWVEYRHDNPTPTTITELRHMVYWLRKWRNAHDGSLLPIPEEQ